MADTQYQVDLRYHGQGLSLTVDADPTELKSKGFNAIGDRFDDLHEQLFTFKSDSEKEVVNLRAVVQGQLTNVSAEGIQSGGNDASAAIISDHSIFYDGRDHQSNLYDRSKLAAGNKIAGPAIVMEMDSTTVILPDYVGEVDRYGNILIRPAQIQ